jgi:hypothetical protein
MTKFSRTAKLKAISTLTLAITKPIRKRKQLKQKKNIGVMIQRGEQYDFTRRWPDLVDSGFDAWLQQLESIVNIDDTTI